MSNVVFTVKGRDVTAQVTNEAGEVKDVPVDNARSGGIKEVLDALGIPWEIKVDPIRVYVAVGEEQNGYIDVLGHGNYVGETVPPAELELGDKPLPTVHLDNGGAIYGNECWWGERVEQELTAHRIKPRLIGIAQFRERRAPRT